MAQNNMKDFLYLITWDYPTVKVFLLQVMPLL